MINYVVVTGDGGELAVGVSEQDIKRVAQDCADHLAETVYYSQMGGADLSDADEDIGTAVEPATVCCECGQWSGERCWWTGPIGETVIVEWMPEHLRSLHEASRNRGSYPANGAQRIRVERSCADNIVEHDGDWCRII